MKRIAIITGATGGIGEEFVKQMLSYDLDEFWVTERNSSKLKQLEERYGSK